VCKPKNKSSKEKEKLQQQNLIQDILECPVVRHTIHKLLREGVGSVHQILHRCCACTMLLLHRCCACAMRASK
jgi:hypothetical protein